MGVCVCVLGGWVTGVDRPSADLEWKPRDSKVGATLLHYNTLPLQTLLHAPAIVSIAKSPPDSPLLVKQTNLTSIFQEYLYLAPA